MREGDDPGPDPGGMTTMVDECTRMPNYLYCCRFARINPLCPGDERVMSSDATVDRKLSEVKIRGLRRVVGTIGRRERGFAESRAESPCRMLE